MQSNVTNQLSEWMPQLPTAVQEHIQKLQEDSRRLEYLFAEDQLDRKRKLALRLGHSFGLYFSNEIIHQDVHYEETSDIMMCFFDRFISVSSYCEQRFELQE